MYMQSVPNRCAQLQDVIIYVGHFESKCYLNICLISTVILLLRAFGCFKILYSISSYELALRLLPPLANTALS